MVSVHFGAFHDATFLMLLILLNLAFSFKYLSMLDLLDPLREQMLVRVCFKVLSLLINFHK